jgi:hypothetical protein
MTAPTRPRHPRGGRPPIRPDRVRRIDERGFSFVPNRFLHDGFFAALSHAERSLYFFLVLAGDRNGTSYYHYDRICSTLEMAPDDYVRVRNALIDKDLVAFDGTRFQVLSLPPAPVAAARPPLVTDEDFEREDPATIGQLIRRELGRRR